MSIALPSLNWLRVFEAAARCESFARAAEELNMSTPSVSQQVRALEERLGRALFERHARSVVLTDAGVAYLPLVQQALQSVENATLGLFGANPSQQIFIQSVQIFAQGLLAPRLPLFIEKYENVAITLNTGFRRLDSSTYFNDLEIVFGRQKTQGLDSDVLVGEELYPVARPEIAHAVTTPKDLLSYRLIEVAPERAGWHFLFDHYKLHAESPKFVYTDDTSTAMVMAQGGMGIAIARAPASNEAMKSGGLVPCLASDGIQGPEFFHLVCRDRTTLRPAARLFREWLLNWCSELRCPH